MASVSRPSALQGIAQVLESLNISRPEVECLPVGRHGLLEPPLVLKGVAQVVMRLGVIGLELQGLAKAGLGLVDPPSRLEDNPQVIPGLGKVGGQPQRAARSGGSRFPGPCLLVNQTQEEPGLAREWILPCDLEEGLLGSARSPARRKPRAIARDCRVVRLVTPCAGTSTTKQPSWGGMGLLLPSVTRVGLTAEV